MLRAKQGALTFTVLRGRTPVIGEADIPVPDGPRGAGPYRRGRAGVGQGRRATPACW